MNLLRTSAVASFALLGMSAAVTAVAAQPGGPYAPLVLMMPSGMRPLAMGNVGVAGRDDDVLFYNPAQLMVARGTSASFERYSGTSSGGALSSVTHLSSGAIAIGVQTLDYKAPFQGSLVFAGGSPSSSTPLVPFPLDRGSSLGPGLGQGMSLEASLGYARTIKGVRIGAAGKYAEDEVPVASIRRAALDVGLARDFSRFLTLGLAVQNIGKSTNVPCVTHSEIGHDNCQVDGEISRPSSLLVPISLPLRTTLGGSFSHQLGELDFVGTAAVSMLKSNGINPAAGAELGYSWIDGYSVALRAGLRRPLPGESGPTAGLGLTMDRLSIDYAAEVLANNRVANRIGLRIR